MYDDDKQNMWLGDLIRISPLLSKFNYLLQSFYGYTTLTFFPSSLWHSLKID